jgi:very-short-patch-repair endonuclease
MLTENVLKKLFHGVEKEYKFHPIRKWRFDYAWPERKIALEQEGGIWTKGRHTRGKGYEADLEKYNNAIMLGWFVLRATPEMIKKGGIYDMLEKLLYPIRFMH